MHDGNGHSDAAGEEKVTVEARTGGPKTPEGRARSLANLKTVRDSESAAALGSLGGRKQSCGSSIKEWMNTMQDWSREELDKVASSEKLPNNQVAAARSLYDSSSREKNSAGLPIARGDLELILDHTAGKARQSVDVSVDASIIRKQETQTSMDKVLTDAESLSALELIGKRIANDTADTRTD